MGSLPRATSARVLLRRRLPAGLDLAEVFDDVFPSPGRRVWLDSSARGSGSGRYSFAAEASAQAGALLTYCVGDAGMRVERFDGGACSTVIGDVLEVLAAQLVDLGVSDRPGVPFIGGLVGWFGYEFKGDLGFPGPHRAVTPDAAWLLVDRVVAIDHDTGEAQGFALVTNDASNRAAGHEWLAQTAQRCTRAGLGSTPPIEQAPRVEASPLGTADVSIAMVPPGSLPANPGPGCLPTTNAEALWRRDRERYVADVQAAKAALESGQSYEVCLTATATTPLAGTALELYLALRQANPAPYSAFLDIGGVQVVSASPERFLHVDAAGRVETRPIKGTAARHRDPVRDLAAAASLQADAKTVAENIVVVDLLRNDLHQVCVPGSVATPRLLEVETYPSVHQLVSTVEGQLRDGLGPLDAVRACFPGGSMTGAPKRRTCEIIDEIEGAPRGIYAGTLGYLSASGIADLAIVIRTAVVRDDWVSVGAGGGIVLDSEPNEEYEEMRLKAEASLRVIRSVNALANAGEVAALAAES